MTKGVNKAVLLGNLTKNPEVRRSPDGRVVTSITIATGEEWKDKTTGEKKTKSEFHRVVIFGKLAEIAEQYLKKGAQVYVEGQLQTRKWQDQQGVERYTTEIIVQGFNGTLQMVGGRQEQSQPQTQYTGASAPSTEPPMVFDDSIPF